jgi:flagellar basal-body rod protein FlgC
MSLFSVFDVAGSGMSAQSIRLNTVASNLSNADNVSSTKAGAYRAKEPVFAAIYGAARADGNHIDGVRVLSIQESPAPIQARYMPGNPQADANGYVYGSNVNPIEEMVNMISASRSYQNNVEVMNTSKQMLLRTLTLGK